VLYPLRASLALQPLHTNPDSMRMSCLYEDVLSLWGCSVSIRMFCLYEGAAGKSIPLYDCFWCEADPTFSFRAAAIYKYKLSVNRVCDPVTKYELVGTLEWWWIVWFLGTRFLSACWTGLELEPLWLYCSYWLVWEPSIALAYWAANVTKSLPPRIN